MATKAASDYDDEQMAVIVARLQRAAPDQAIDQRYLRRRLLDLLFATGSVQEDEFAEEFASLTATEPLPSLLTKIHGGLSRSRTLSVSLAPEAASTSLLLKISADIRGRLRRTSREAATDFHVAYDTKEKRLECKGVTDANAAAVRAASAAAAAYHQSLVSRGPRTQQTLNTLLLGLADIYREHRQRNEGLLDLPHGDRSHFILFASAALSPFFKTEVEANALAQRWENLKTLLRRGRPQPKPKL